MKPLEGLRVIEFANYVAAPATSKIMAMWGADVIHVESFDGDVFRFNNALYKLPLDRDDANPCFDISSSNKRYVAIDLRTAEGKRAMDKLLSTADVFISNIRNKSLEKLGLTYEQIREKYPRLIYGYLSGYGEKGADKDTAGYDYTSYCARGGILAEMADSAGDAPAYGVSAYGDLQASVCLGFGILAALMGREKTGKGDKVSASLYRTAAYMMNLNIVASKFGYRGPFTRKEAITPSMTTYPTSDGRWFQLCAPMYNRDFNKIMRAIGREDLTDSALYCDLETVRAAGRNAEVVAIIEAETRKHDVDYWMRVLKEHDIACEKAYLWEEIAEDPQAWENGFYQMVDYPDGRKIQVFNDPVALDSVGIPEFKPAKGIGYDTADVLREVGYSDEEINGMAAAKAIAVHE